jgi:3alpha(or 20beta)-hydroxysteroid dehydrogenase
MAGRFEGRVALISGGARGMGATEARRFVAEGARVVIGDLLDADGQALAKELGDAVHYVHLDVTSESEWQAAVGHTTEAFGRLDILVNNAGILRVGPIEQMPAKDFELVVRVNQIGTFLGIKSVIGAMRAAGGGAIINISSIAGLVGIAGVGAYVASKHAVRGLTKTAALELGRDGIRVNSVHPGGIDTPMTTSDPAAYATYPIPRVGEPDEVANMVLFLASDEAAYCTGGEYLVDGGATAGRLGHVDATSE